MPDKKKGLAAALVDGLDSPDENTMSDEEIAADDVITAIQEEDPAALVDAMKAFLEMCENGKDKKESKKDDQTEM